MAVVAGPGRRATATGGGGGGAGRFRPPEGWLRSVALTMAFALLVAAAVADRGSLFPVVVIGTAGLGLGLLYLLFPHGIHFAFGTSAGLAVYACLYVVIGRAGFPAAEGWARAPGFLLPVAAFLVAVWRRRATLAVVAEASRPFELSLLPRMARWLLPVWAVGLICLSAPVNRLPPLGQSLALLAAMAVIAGIVAASVRGVVLLLTDVALLMEELGQRISQLAVPMAAFLTLYLLLVVAFASFYRIADGLSRTPLFDTPLGPTTLDFPQALYFSLVTQATVGYGDLTPHDEGVRLLAAAQVVLGQLLLLFGFAELMRGSRPRPGNGDRPEAEGGSRGNHSAAPAPGVDSGGGARRNDGGGGDGGASGAARRRPVARDPA